VPTVNHLGQPIGDLVTDWVTRPRPPKTAIEGLYCRLEPIDPTRHTEDLYNAFRADTTGQDWTYLSHGPYHSADAFHGWLVGSALGDDPLFYAVVDRTSGRALGMLSYLRIEPTVGVIEVGHVTFSPALQQTVASTEAQFLMMQRAFDELGYRRYEWKCDDLNTPSRRAAIRLGFQFEGVFRQATIYKGRNRDTAWYAILDRDWPRLRAAFERWLLPENFDSDGNQILSLGEIRAIL